MTATFLSLIKQSACQSFKDRHDYLEQAVVERQSKRRTIVDRGLQSFFVLRTAVRIRSIASMRWRRQSETVRLPPRRAWVVARAHPSEDRSTRIRHRLYLVA